MRPDAALLDRLSSSRYRLNRAQASVGVGDRRSRAKGAGMEFASHRPYREGDDVRQLDPRLLARLGQHYVREYFVDRQAPVYVLLDGSRSMQYGRPNKLARGMLLTQVFGFLALASGDSCQIGFAGQTGLHWSPRFHGKSRADLLFDWVGHDRGGGEAGLGATLSTAARDMRPRALVIVISDFLDAAAPAALQKLGAMGHDVLALHLAAPEEIDPGGLGGGTVTLADIETGESVEMTLNAALRQAYRESFAGWQAELAQAARTAQGWYYFLPTEAPIEPLFLSDLRRDGILS